LVGKLIYLSHMRPNIVYAISVISQFMHDPRERYMLVVDKILQYLKSSPEKGLFFRKGNYPEDYTNVDYASYVIDRKSTSGCSMFLSGESLLT